MEFIELRCYLLRLSKFEVRKKPTKKKKMPPNLSVSVCINYPNPSTELGSFSFPRQHQLQPRRT